MKKSSISVLEVKKLRKEELISKDEYHDEIVDIFRKSLDFKFSEVIGRGSFSTVLRVWNENAENGFAMKIVLDEDIGPNEKEWGQLDHESILPLLDTESFPLFDLTWFLSPVVGLTLEDVLQRKILEKDYMAAKFVVSWVRQIASALNYMHEKELSFLNLKLSNVMICKDDKIKLFGFHRLSKIGEFTTRYDVPDIFRPPESYSADGRKLPVEGKTFDLWCLGVLSIEVFTGGYLSRNIPDEVCCWSDVIYPQMFKILKKNKFNKEYRVAFPNCKLLKNTLKSMRNFCRSFLRISPESRPSTEILLNHKLFEWTGLLGEKDKIWKKELKVEAMIKKIKDMNFLYESVEPVTRNTDIQTDWQNTKTVNIGNEVPTDSKQENAVLEGEVVEVVEEEVLPNIGENFGEGNDMLSNQILFTFKPDLTREPTKIVNIDNEDSIDNKEENAALDIGEQEVLGEEALPNSGENAEEHHEMLPHDISPPVKIESPDNLFLVQGMFGRILVDNCQEDMICRLLHRETFVKTMKIVVGYKRKDKDYAVYSENDDDVKSKQFSSRTSSLGFKIASKVFQYFI